MGLYNWLVICHKCPTCGGVNEIKAQTHIASDGHYFNHEYRIGDRMGWWPHGHLRYDSWRSVGIVDPSKLAVDEDMECCYASCPACNAELYVVARVKNFVFCEVLDVGLETNWPKGFYR